MKAFNNHEEAQRHQHAIESLAIETQAPVDEVRAIYETELKEVKNRARVEDFVPTFAHRRARQVLKRRR